MLLCIPLALLNRRNGINALCGAGAAGAGAVGARFAPPIEPALSIL